MTEAFDLMSNSIFDNIINYEEDDAMNLDDIWKSDLTNNDPNNYPLIPTLEDFCQVNNIVIDSKEDLIEQQDQPYNELNHHDCMWSGTCVDDLHPLKKKNYRIFANGSETIGDSITDAEMEMMLENNLPSNLNSFTRNMQNDPAIVFQEILQSAWQNNKLYTQPSTSKVNNQQQFTTLQPVYSSTPIYNNQYHYTIPKNFTKMVDIKKEPAINKLIKIENVNIEPIVVQHSTIIREQPVQEVLFYNKEPAPTVPYFPQVKYEHYNVMPQPIYLQSQNINFNNANTPVCMSSDSFGFQNLSISAMDRSISKQLRQSKRKFQVKRKSTKRSKVKGKKNRVTNKRRKHGGRMLCSQPSTSAGSDEDPLEKRVIHNSMERQRRIGLKNLFIELKQVIPILDDRERVPKVSILREAIDYCRKLRADEKLLDDLKKKNNKLMARYYKLLKTINKKK